MQLITPAPAIAALALASAAFAQPSPETASPGQPVTISDWQVGQIVVSAGSQPGSLTVSARETACRSSGEKSLDDDIAVAVDREARRIVVSGSHRYRRPLGGIGTTDCALPHEHVFQLEDVPPGDYTVSYGDHELARVTFPANGDPASLTIDVPPHSLPRRFDIRPWEKSQPMKGVIGKRREALALDAFEDWEEGQLEFHVRQTGCISSSFRPDGDTFTPQVDKEAGTIAVDGQFRFKPLTGNIVKKDCGGRRNAIIEIEWPGSGSYRLFLNGEDRGEIRLTDDHRVERYNP